MQYRPASGAVINFSAGTWSAPTKPSVQVAVRLDARLLTWLVNKAARHSPMQYEIRQGTPPILVTLTHI